MRRSLQFFVAAAIALSASAQAQTPGAVTAGTVALFPELPDKEALDRRIEAAPWRSGIFRFSPWLGVRNASSVLGTNVGDGTRDTDDFTISVGAGLRAYVRNGPKVIWALHALPEYTWWADDEDRRRLNGRYGAGVFAHGNRLELEVSHRLSEEQGFFSSEVQRLTPTRESRTRAIAGLRVTRHWWLVAGGRRLEVRNQEDDNARLALLDRELESLRAGIEYRGGTGWRMRAAWEDEQARFDAGGRALSNDSTLVLAGASWTGNRFGIDLELAERSIDPDVGSQVVARDETLGRVQAIWGLTAKSSLLTGVERTMQYALATESTYFLVERYRVAWQADAGRVATVALFVETGDDTFRAAAGGGAERVDDVTSYGARIDFDLGRKLRVHLDGRFSDYTSSLPGVDRDSTVVGIGVDILPFERFTRRAFERLRVGDPTGDW